MPLTDVLIRALKPGPKTYRRSDSGGLYIEVPPSGRPRWRWKFRFLRKEKKLPLGVYPVVGLKEARLARDAARKLLASGIDPTAARKAVRAESEARRRTFEAVAREWFAKRRATWAPAHADTIIWRLERYVFPEIGKKAIQEVDTTDLAALLEKIEARQIIETAHRVRTILGQVFRYAKAKGYCKHNPVPDLRDVLPPAQTTHFAGITDPKELGALLRAIDGYEGRAATRCALRLSPLVFVRPSELRRAEWPEIDEPAALWRIPVSRMKMRRGAHLVPLSRQALAILAELRTVTGAGRFLFPSERTKDRPMSNNTLNAGLRRLGFTKDEVTGHGFRSTASTLLNENGWNRDVIERQMAHEDDDDVRAAYNRAEYLDERKRMMQWWGDFLDDLRKQK